MRITSKVLVVLALLGTVTAFAPSFFSTTPSNKTMSVALAAPAPWRCIYCNKTVRVEKADDLNKYATEKCDKAPLGMHQWKAEF